MPIDISDSIHRAGDIPGISEIAALVLNKEQMILSTRTVHIAKYAAGIEARYLEQRPGSSERRGGPPPAGNDEAALTIGVQSGVQDLVVEETAACRFMKMRDPSAVRT